METALVSLVSIALVIIGTLTMTMSYLRSASTMADSWRQMEQQVGNILRTEIVATPPVSYSGGVVNLTVANEGQVNLGDFSYWDVIIQYQNGQANYIAYTEYPPGSNQWAVEGIYQSDNVTELFDLNLLNPGEEMIMAINLNPEIGEGTTGKITIATPNGVTSQCLVSRPLP